MKGKNTNKLLKKADKGTKLRKKINKYKDSTKRQAQKYYHRIHENTMKIIIKL